MTNKYAPDHPAPAPEQQPRLIELVNELVGAQTVAKMISDALSSLTEEQKKQITDAMATDEELVTRLAKEAFAKLEASWPQAVDDATKRWIAQALETVRKKFDDVAKGF